MDKNTIVFYDEESGEDLDFYILEETVLNEKNYLCVTDADPDDEEALVYVLEKTGETDEEATYTVVDDEETLKAVLAVFSELMGDTDFTLENE
ncbi:Protein of unknown function [Lachnospiraceae bacterium C10]|jgi:hypothetical protein|nr:DUF1292 domain-containing protein [Lachnospiraceae bacterium]SCW32557.1 Protein of unknown function [Lachnospiraceae bacterium C10]SDW00088.1 Protein of unknown function [Lachnospiraceae bacterium KHCPX20]